jgi:hypothetical protein
MSVSAYKFGWQLFLHAILPVTDFSSKMARRAYAFIAPLRFNT